MRKILLVVFVCGLVAAFTPSLYAGPTFGQAFTGAAAGSQLGNGPFTLGWSFNAAGTRCGWISSAWLSPEPSTTTPTSAADERRNDRRFMHMNFLPSACFVNGV
jgi:hypothetical protein